VIASGPTVPQVLDTADARHILQKYDLWPCYPERFRHALLASAGERTTLREPDNILLANNQTVQMAAAEQARKLGFVVKIVDKPLAGEARIAGKSFAQRLRAEDAESCCYIQGGETTVTVRGEGTGGRNQEFAVAAGQFLESGDCSAIFSFATDGIDGPTDAAGAIVDSEFVRRTQSLGLDPERHLKNNNVYPLLNRIGALIHTGPTRTNLNDVAVGLKYPAQH